jgi:prepilin-type N-terminal cleavage/methylation domain-containing protein
MGSDRKYKECKSYDDGFGMTRGLTLIEVLVAIAIGSIVVLALYEVFMTQNRIYTLQDDAGEMQQNLRVGMERISRDLTMAGFGKPGWSTVNGTDLSAWYNSPNFTPIRTVTVGTNTELDIVGCLDPSPGTLTNTTATGSTSLTLASGQGGGFDASVRSDVSILGRENLKVTGVTGDTLTVDSDPATPGTQGTKNAYASNADVCVVKRVTYSIDASTTPSVLQVNEYLGAGNQPIAQYISGLTVAVAGRLATITLTGKSRNPDRTTGLYNTSSVTTKVYLRNN